jgi:hypothetical protein
MIMQNDKYYRVVKSTPHQQVEMEHVNNYIQPPTPNLNLVPNACLNYYIFN